MLSTPDITTLEKVINNEKDTLEAMLKSARIQDQEGFTAAATRLVTVVATSIPILGPLASEGVRLAWAQSTYAQVEATLDTLEKEQQEDERARNFTQLTAALMSQALVGFSEQLRDELASRAQVEQINEKLDAFHKDFRERMVRSNIKLLKDGATGAEFNSSKKPATNVEVNVDTATGKGTTVLKFT